MLIDVEKKIWNFNYILDNVVIEDDDNEENEEIENINESPKLENIQNLEGLQNNNNNFDDIFNAYRKPVKKNMNIQII